MYVMCIQAKKDEMGRTCSTHKEDERLHGFGGQARSVEDRQETKT
jgi:hypothetical protein